MQPRTLLILLISLLALAGSTLSAQTEQLITTQNEPIAYTFLSEFTPSIGQSPDHGTIELVESPQFNYTLTYTPADDFLGLDNFLLVYHPFDSGLQFQNFTVEVKLADVRARRDQAVVVQGGSVSIPVLDNDFSNVGSLSLRAVPVTNAGRATVNGDEVVFTPDAGFSGLTDLNYVVCTESGVCELGTVTINVLPASGTAADTVRVFTKRGKPQFIFAESGAEAIAAPQNGTLSDSNGVLTYLPDSDFVGVETLVYSNPATGGQTTFDVRVLDLQDNAFAVEDYAYTATDAPITLNVIHNDLYTVFTDCVAFGTPRYGSLVETGTRGEVTYQPPVGWSGVDRFEYSSKAPGCGGEAELTTVYVYVSDYTPVSAEAVLDIPAGSDAEITYEVPNGQAVWTEHTPPIYGTLTRNAATGGLTYSADAGAAGRKDFFQIAYCLEAPNGNSCTRFTVQLVEVNIGAAQADGCSGADCVWPGDTNNDGVVDVGDLLPIGAMMGRSGTPRLAGNPAYWAGQGSEDWGETYEGIDIKHIDANGDQVISAEDTAVVLANIGKAHRLRGEASTFTTFDLSIIGPEEAAPGDLIQLDIIAGSETVIVEDIYGFRFPVRYDQGAVVDTSMSVGIDEGGWISYDSPVLSVFTNDTERGVLNASMTRTNGKPTSGFGVLGTLETVIVEDIYGFALDPDASGDAGSQATLTFGGGTGVATGSNGRQKTVNIRPFDLKVVDRSRDLGEESAEDAGAYLDRNLLAFPNPASDQLTVHLNGQQEFSQVQLTDVTGRVALRQTGLSTNHQVFDVTNLSGGVYTLTITTPAGVANRRVYVR